MPTDGSQPSTAAVKRGVAIAEPHKAILHFLPVIDVGTEMSASGVGTIADELKETLEQEAKEALDEAVTHAADLDEDERKDFEETVEKK